jgi:hypothetical protein
VKLLLLLLLKFVRRSVFINRKTFVLVSSNWTQFIYTCWVDNTQQLFFAIIYLKMFVLAVVVALPSTGLRSLNPVFHLRIFSREAKFSFVFIQLVPDGSSWETKDKLKIRFARKNSQVENRLNREFTIYDAAGSTTLSKQRNLVFPQTLVLYRVYKKNATSEFPKKSTLF